MTATIEDAILGPDQTGEAMLLLMAKPLSKYREEHYMTVREFAKFLGIAQDTYFRIINGETRAHPTTIRRIADKLHVHPSDIKEFVVSSDDADK